MRQLLIIVLLAVVGFGLPGVLDIGKLFSGVGLLDGVEKLLTNNDASTRATASTGLSHSSESDTIRDKGESGSLVVPLTVHSSTPADVSTDTSSSQRLTGNSDTLGQKSLPEAGTKQSTGQDTLTLKGVSELHATSEAVGTSDDVGEDTSKAEADESPTTSSSAQEDNAPKTVVHTQFVVVAPGERSTLVIAEPESFSAMDNSAYEAALPLSPICMTLLSIVITLF
ncbi:hypothetical protein GGI16_002041 [Coemansia sp. S142-1]|nr:hypothetical protein GGI16_002041 [Coemansia sp. S142-1]